MQMTPDMVRMSNRWQKFYESPDRSVAHQWMHIRKVAEGAAFFVKSFDGTEKEQQLAYAAGILHDCTRERFEKGRKHNETGAEMAAIILQDYSSFTIDEIMKICQAIKCHREPMQQNVQQIIPEEKVQWSVYLADKLFEHLGAYIAFRGPAWVGECGDKYFGETPSERMLDYYKRVERRIFDKSNFPKQVHALFDYQTAWFKEFGDSVKNQEDWAADIVNHFYEVGKNNRNLETSLTLFKPKTPEQTRFYKETMDYVNGNKNDEFVKMIKV